MPNKLDNIETLTDLDLSHNDLPRGTIFKREISRELKNVCEFQSNFQNTYAISKSSLQTKFCYSYFVWCLLIQPTKGVATTLSF